MQRKQKVSDERRRSCESYVTVVAPMPYARKAQLIRPQKTPHGSEFNQIKALKVTQLIKKKRKKRNAKVRQNRRLWLGLKRITLHKFQRLHIQYLHTFLCWMSNVVVRSRKEWEKDISSPPSFFLFTCEIIR